MPPNRSLERILFSEGWVGGILLPQEASPRTTGPSLKQGRETVQGCCLNFLPTPRCQCCSPQPLPHLHLLEGRSWGNHDASWCQGLWTPLSPQGGACWSATSEVSQFWKDESGREPGLLDLVQEPRMPSPLSFKQSYYCHTSSVPGCLPFPWGCGHIMCLVPVQV